MLLWKLGARREAEIEAIREGLRLGMNLIDTAEMYHTEDLVGAAVSGAKGVFLATKVSPNHFRYDDVISACDASLKRLGAKSIDLYQLHWPNSDIPISETIKAMEKLKNDGKIRHIGVSNFSVEEMEEARAAAKSSDIVSNQVEYSPYVRYVEETVVPYCRKNGITVIAYSPLARGALSNTSSITTTTLKRIASRHGCTPAQVALSWLTSKGNVVAIPKAADIIHVKENAASPEIGLSPKEAAEIDGLQDDSVTPVASRLNKFTKKTASFWSSLMDKRERLRVKHGI